eukprot:2295606-Amphidinium_carterae.1
MNACRTLIVRELECNSEIAAHFNPSGIPSGGRPQGAPGDGPPLRVQMIHAAQRELVQRARRREIRRFGQPYNGRARPHGEAANLNVNIYQHGAVVEVDGGDRYEPPDFGPVRFDELMRANFAEAEQDDSDGDGFGVVREERHDMADQGLDDEEDEPEILNMDDDAPLVRENEYPYPTNFEELVVTPDHLDWSARVVCMLNRRQHVTWDSCHLCGMYCSSRWCNSCDQP